MHSVFHRTGSLLAYVLAVFGLVTLLVFLSTGYLDSPTATCQINVRNVFVVHREERSAYFNYDKTSSMNVGLAEQKDVAFLMFDINADFTSIFNWNVKLLFIYVSVEYETPTNKMNQVIIWDEIIQRGEQTVLDQRNVKPKYLLWDDGNGLLGNKNATLRLSYQVIPNVAVCFYPRIVAGEQIIEFPDEYYSSSRMWKD